MKVLVTGAGGQLGSDIMDELAGRGWETFGSVRTAEGMVAPASCSLIELDIRDREAVHAAIQTIRPDAVVHCAAWTAVDAAEAEENREAVRAVNSLGTRYVAESCAQLGCKLVYISTDYVFDGKATGLRQADCEEYGPLNHYGRTKLVGELAVRELTDRYFILRTQWVFGSKGGNFVKTMLRLGESRESLRVVNDQYGSPSYTRDLARLIADMCLTEKYGCYNATNEGEYISWYDFAKEIFRQAGRDIRVVPVTTEEYGISQASRPLNSRLDRSKLAEMGFKALPDWHNALERYLNEAVNISSQKV